MSEAVAVYVVQNSEGKYFRSTGYGVYGERWVSELVRARIYPRIGQAKGRVTFFTREYPEFGAPKIVRFDLTNPQVMDVAKETKRSIQKIEERAERSEIRRRAEEVKRLEAEIGGHQKRLKAIKEGK